MTMRQLVLDAELVAESDFPHLPEGAWALTLPTNLPDGKGVAALESPGQTPWVAVILVRGPLVTICGVWRSVPDAMHQFLCLTLAEEICHALPPDVIDRLMQQAAQTTTNDERNAVIEAWVRSVGGEDAAKDPIGYFMEWLSASASAGHTTVH